MTKEMFAVTGISFCFLLLLFLDRRVVANEPIDSICQSSSDYLKAMYTCRYSDFQTMSFCRTRSPHELSCNKTQRIAVHSASIGPSHDTQCNQPDTVVYDSSTGRTDATGNECCLLPPVENKCQGRAKCGLNINDLLQSVEGRLCPFRNNERHQRPLRLTVVFICVTQKIIKEMKRDMSSPDDFCDGHLDANVGEGVLTPGIKPVEIFELEKQSTTAVVKHGSEEPTNNGGHNSLIDKEESSVSSPIDDQNDGSVDWIWSLLFIQGNMDRFLIYLFLSIAIGIICVLVVVIVVLCCGHRLQKTEPAPNGISYRKQSSTQTTDVTTSLIASNQSPGIEMVRYVQSDSLRTPPMTRHSTSTPVSGNAAVHFASDSDSSQPCLPMQQTGAVSTFSRNGGVAIQNLNVPQYQINASRDSVDSGGGSRTRATVDNEDYRSSTLGRFYSNPYRHDSYRSDGYRTLQHK